jgi:hypothetical protein
MKLDTSTLPVRTLDGSAFADFSGFCVEFSRSILNDEYEWTGNLDAFNDILHGGFGTPEGVFVLRWKNAGASRRALGHEAMCAWLERNLTHCHPSNVAGVKARLKDAKEARGETLFDMIVGIIRENAPTEPSPTWGVVLQLGG